MKGGHIPELLVRVLSYNIFMRPPGIHEKPEHNDYKDERLKLFLQNEIFKWDIVAFQELFGTLSHRRHKLIKEAKKTWGFLYHAHAPHPSPFSKHLVDGGLVIISKFPILESGYYVYTEGAAADALSAKGVLHAKIKLMEGLMIHCFTTHLQASYASKEKDRAKFEAIRDSQLLELQEFVHEKTGHDCHPILLMGDMNTNMELVPNGPPPHEYLNMMKTLSSKYFIPIDILYHLYGHRPVTGFSEEISKLHLTCVSVESSPHAWRSLDYILILVRKEYNTLTAFEVKELGQTQSTIEVCPTTEKITSRKGNKFIELTTLTGLRVEIEGSVEFFKTPEGMEFTTLSDHFGVSVTFRIRKEFSANVPCPLETH